MISIALVVVGAGLFLQARTTASLPLLAASITTCVLALTALGVGVLVHQRTAVRVREAGGAVSHPGE